MAYSFEKVQAEPVLATVRRLEQRIDARFPGRGLYRIVGELGRLVEEVATSTASVRDRRSWLRPLAKAGIVAVVVLTVALLGMAVRAAVVDAPDSGLEWVPLLESGVNDMVFAALAIWFLGPLFAFANYRPLEPTIVRIWIIVGIFALVLLRLLIRVWKKQRMNARLIDAVMGLREAKPATPDDPSRAAIDELRANFERALGQLKKTRFGGKKEGGSGRGQHTGNPAAHKGGRLGGKASGERSAADRSASARKAAATRKRNAEHHAHH